MRGILLLEDGSIFEGTAYGKQGIAVGEVVFNTGMTGFQEVLTDPSYCGQIVTMTYPLIGNYGVCAQDSESRKPYVRGFVVRELCDVPSNWRTEQPIADFLYQHDICCLADVDTRALTKRIRTHGTLKGVIACGDYATDDLRTALDGFSLLQDAQCVKDVTTPQVYKMGSQGAFKVVVVDFGAKLNILHSLVAHGCNLTIVPAGTTAEEILAYQPDGVFLSNGPGNPKEAHYAIDTVKRLIGEKPIFGICLGHQLLALAAGADTYKLKFGHRGSNHPVKELQTGRVYITSQNHGYAVDQNTLKDTGFEVSHVGLNDNTVEGLRHQELPIFSVQYHPEAAPGPLDSQYLFDQFVNLMRGEKKIA